MNEVDFKIALSGTIWELYFLRCLCFSAPKWQISLFFLAKNRFRLWSSTFFGGGTCFYEKWTSSEHSMMWNGWLIFFGFLNLWFIFTRNISEFGHLNMQSLLGFLMCRVFTKNTLIAIHLSTYLSSPFQYQSTASLRAMILHQLSTPSIALHH